MEEAINNPEPPVAPIITSHKLAGQAMLERRLQSLDSPAVSQLDPTFITNAEYQLFIDEMQAQDRYFQPLHWTEETFPAGQADQPVTGVTPYGAFEFCNWLTDKYGGSTIRYRLPNSSELTETSSDDSSNTLLAWHQSPLDKFVLPPLNQSILQELRDFSIKNSAPIPMFQLENPGDYLTMGHGARRAYAIVRALDLNFSPPTSFTINLARSLNYDLILDKDLQFGLILDLNLDISSALDLDRPLDLNLTQVLARSRAFSASAFPTSRDQALHRARALSGALSGAHGIACILSHTFAIDFPDTTEVIESDTCLRVLELIQAVQDNPSGLTESIQRRAILLVAILQVLIADTVIKQRKAVLVYLIHYYEYVWIGYGRLIQETQAQRVTKPKKHKARLPKFIPGPKLDRLERSKKYKQDRENITRPYGCLQILAAREAGQLPAWEGIRLVRERKESSNY